MTFLRFLNIFTNSSLFISTYIFSKILYHLSSICASKIAKNPSQSYEKSVLICQTFFGAILVRFSIDFKPINHPKTPPGRPQGVSKKPIPPTIFMPWAPRLPTSLPSRAQDSPEAPQNAPDRLPRQPNRSPSDPKSLKSRSHI